MRMSIFIESEIPLHINILILPETSMMCLAAVLEPMRAVNRITGRNLFKWHITTLDGASIELSSGIAIAVDGKFYRDLEGDLMMLMAGLNHDHYIGDNDIIDIKQVAQNHTAIAGIEAGAWLLAHAGLLNNKRATTHWEDLEDFAAAYPLIDVVNDRSVVDGDILTTAGSTPTIHLMLSLIQARYGFPTAIEVSAIFIYENSNHYSDKQHIVSLNSILKKSDLVAQAISLMEQFLDEPLTVDNLACRLSVSIRKLEKDFLKTIGKSPGTYYRELRARNACRLVVDTSLDIREIAIRTGFTSLPSFSRCFKRIYKHSPTQYRQLHSGLAVNLHSD